MMKLKDYPYERVDIGAQIKSMEETEEKLRLASNAECFDQAFLEGLTKERHLREMYLIAYIRNSIDIRDPFYNEELNYYNREMPVFEVYKKHIYQVLFNSPYMAELERKYGEFYFLDMAAQQRLYSNAVIDDLAKESILCGEYSEMVCEASILYEGKMVSFSDLQKDMMGSDRKRRRMAMYAWADLYKSIASGLDGIYEQLTQLRIGMAKKLGFKSYIEMAYLLRKRHDYTSDDLKLFRKQVLEEVVPFCQKLFEQQKKQIGVDHLHYYDEGIRTLEGAPSPIGGVKGMLESFQKMYHEMSPESIAFFDQILEYEMYDLEAKPGKQGGGYCDVLLEEKVPFVFANCNGTNADMVVLTHELGHAFQQYLCTRSQAIPELYWSPGEIDEVPSMAMELLAHPWMEDFFGGRADEYRKGHLFECLQKIPYIVCVDEFQHCVFENPEMDAAKRRAVWREIERKYMPWRDYDGNEFLEEGGYWMQKLHIFTLPFFYIEYAMAQVSALEFYIKAKKDRKECWDAYCRLCRTGRRLGYRESLLNAGLSNPLETGTIRRIIESLKEELLGDSH